MIAANEPMMIKEGSRIAFLGDSITENGLYIAIAEAFFWHYKPGIQMTWMNMGLSGETASGLSEPSHSPPRPCIQQRLERALESAKADYVMVCYGMNDGIYHPFAEDRFAAYCSGMKELIGQIHASGARAIVMTPPIFDEKSIPGKLSTIDAEEFGYAEPYEGYNQVLDRYVEWVKGLQEEVHTVIDIYTPLRAFLEQQRALNPGYRWGDGIHPEADGHRIMAQTLIAKLLQTNDMKDLNDTHDMSDMNGMNGISLPAYFLESGSPDIYAKLLKRHEGLSAAWREHIAQVNQGKEEAQEQLSSALQHGASLEQEIRELILQADHGIQIRKSVWNGYLRYDFHIGDHEALLIVPKEAAPGRPWVWRTEFFDAFAQADHALLAKGWHLAYYQVSDRYGCPESIELMHTFQQQAGAAFGLAEQAALFGFSRGGLYAFNYAATYPQQVAALYLDAPVLDIRSWPGGKGSGIGSPAEWIDCMAHYCITEEQAAGFKGNPLDQIERVAAHHIPIILVSGDADQVVPYTENGAILDTVYRELGGEIETIVKPGVDHHPHSLEDPTPIVDFILSKHV